MKGKFEKEQLILPLNDIQPSVDVSTSLSPRTPTSTTKRHSPSNSGGKKGISPRLWFSGLLKKTNSSAELITTSEPSKIKGHVKKNRDDDLSVQTPVLKASKSDLTDSLSPREHTVSFVPKSASVPCNAIIEEGLTEIEPLDPIVQLPEIKVISLDTLITRENGRSELYGRTCASQDLSQNIDAKLAKFQSYPWYTKQGLSILLMLTNPRTERLRVLQQEQLSLLKEILSEINTAYQEYLKETQDASKQADEFIHFLRHNIAVIMDNSTLVQTPFSSEKRQAEILSPHLKFKGEFQKELISNWHQCRAKQWMANFYFHRAEASSALNIILGYVNEHLNFNIYEGLLKKLEKVVFELVDLLHNPIIKNMGSDLEYFEKGILPSHFCSLKDLLPSRENLGGKIINNISEYFYILESKSIKLDKGLTTKSKVNTYIKFEQTKFIKCNQNEADFYFYRDSELCKKITEIIARFITKNEDFQPESTKPLSPGRMSSSIKRLSENLIELMSSGQEKLNMVIPIKQ